MVARSCEFESHPAHIRGGFFGNHLFLYVLYTRARSLYYILYAYEGSQFPGISAFTSFCCPNALIFLKNYFVENQRITKKVHFLCIFFAKIFGQFKKKQYLCTRF